MKKITLLLFLLFSIYTAGAQTADYPEYVGSVEGIKEYKLKNGLKILLIPDPTQSNVIVNIVYNVGSRHEGYGEKGMAHLLEHMLFKSTENLGDIKKMLSDKGGVANGTTWLDRTNYYEVFPSGDENLRWSLEMEADRMLNATMLQSDLDKEFSVVHNEFEIGENNPTRILMERIISTAYLWHNYGNSTIGSREDIERVKTDRLKVFYQKYYQPDNATLVIGGKFDEKAALDAVSQYFGVLERPARVLDKTYTVEPAQDGQRYVELKRAGDVQLVAAAYHTVSYADKDAAPIDALIEILTSDPSGYLYKALIDTQKASRVYAYQPTLRDPGYVYFNVQVPKDKSLEEAKDIFLATLDNIPTMNITEEDVARAKSKLLKSLENQRNNTIGFTVGLTEVIGAGDYRLFFLYRDAVENMTLDDVKRVAERYFRTNNRTYGVFIPSTDEIRVKPNEILDEDIVKLTANYKGKEQEEEDLSFEATIANIKANMEVKTLDTGFKYAFLKKPVKGKKVTASFRAPIGNLDMWKGKGNVASIMGQMLKSGTKSKTKEQIQDLLDNTKSSLSFSFGGQSLNINVSTYQEHMQTIFDLIHEILHESVFPENEFSKIITNTKSGIESRKNDPQSVAFREISRLTSNYPKEHLYYTPTIDEELARIDAVTREQVIGFYNNYLGGSNAIGTVLGDLNSADVDKLMSSAFGGWSSKAKYEKIEPIYYQTKDREERVNTPDKENAAMVGAISFRMDQKSPDYPAMVMANEMLGEGGFLTSRIPTRLREKEGISYGAGSFQEIRYDNDIAQWYVYAFFNPTLREKVDSVVKEEINKAINDGFTDEELENSMKGWLTQRNTALGMDGFLTGFINSALYNNSSLDDFTELEAKVKSLSVGKVNEVIRKYLKSSGLTLIYAGDFDKK